MYMDQSRVKNLLRHEVTIYLNALASSPCNLYELKFAPASLVKI